MAHCPWTVLLIIESEFHFQFAHHQSIIQYLKLVLPYIYIIPSFHFPIKASPTNSLQDGQHPQTKLASLTSQPSSNGKVSPGVGGGDSFLNVQYHNQVNQGGGSPHGGGHHLSPMSSIDRRVSRDRYVCLMRDYGRVISFRNCLCLRAAFAFIKRRHLEASKNNRSN